MSTKPAAARIGTHNAASIFGIIGATGMGKGATIKAEILPGLPGPVIVWSPLEETDQYAKFLRCKRVTALPAVIEAWRARRSVVYEPPLDPKQIATRFDVFCRAAWHMTGAVIIVEELARVTTPSWAPTAWKNLTTAGRHRGLTIIGTCQRPAQVDKDFFGGCSELRVFRVNTKNDAMVMADVLFIDWHEVLRLEKLHYVRRVIDDRRNALHLVGHGILADPFPPVQAPAAVTQIGVTPSAEQKKSLPRKRKNPAKRQ